jgi:CspA family cold shock protein
MARRSNASEEQRLPRPSTGILDGETETGTVKWFNDVRGYGFIERDGGGRDLFVHFTAIEAEVDHRTLKEGQRVEFEAEEGSPGKKPRAARVRVIEQ